MELQSLLLYWDAQGTLWFLWLVKLLTCHLEILLGCEHVSLSFPGLRIKQLRVYRWHTGNFTSVRNALSAPLSCLYTGGCHPHTASAGPLAEELNSKQLGRSTTPLFPMMDPCPSVAEASKEDYPYGELEEPVHWTRMLALLSSSLTAPTDPDKSTLQCK